MKNLVCFHPVGSDGRKVRSSRSAQLHCVEEQCFERSGS
jgi:hypothetical protein